MRILSIHNKYKIKGGEDVVFKAECELLEDHGHEVRAVLFDNKAIHGVVGKLNTLMGVISNKSSYKRVRDEVISFSPDIIHVHNFFPLVSPVVFDVAHENAIPIVLTLHNYRLICPGALLLRNEKTCEVCVNSTFPFKGVINKCYRNSLIETAALGFMNYWHNEIGTWGNKIDRFIVLTDFAKKKFLNSSLNVEGGQFVTKPNFVPDYGEGGGGDRFLFVGRLSHEKGISVLLETFSQSNFKLAIIGEGPLINEVEEAEKVNKNITYLGCQGRKAVIKAMKSCRALIFPSIWYEGMPMTILEAFSCGCPVIASKLGSMVELIEDQVNGLHFKPGDSVDLRSKLELITVGMRGGARDSYLKKFTPEENYKSLINIYQSLFLTNE